MLFVYGLHVISAQLYWVAFLYSIAYVKTPKEATSSEAMRSTKRERLKFLTIWNAALQAGYFTVCAVVDLFGWEGGACSQGAVGQAKDYAFTALAFPIGLFVCLSFWGLYAVDPELLFRGHPASYYPPWLNHALHTLVAVWVALEMTLVRHVYHDLWKNVAGILAFKGAYIFWLHVEYWKSGLWAYRVFDGLAAPHRILLLIFMVLSVLALFGLGALLHRIRWGTVYGLV